MAGRARLGQGHAEGDAGCLHAVHSTFGVMPLNCFGIRADWAFQHDDLYDILYDAAVAHGAQIRYEANVVSVDPEAQEVTLESGEKIGGDVIVGADGEFGLCRAAVIGQPVFGAPTGVAMYEYVAVSSFCVTIPLMFSIVRSSTANMCRILLAHQCGKTCVAYPLCKLESTPHCTSACHLHRVRQPQSYRCISCCKFLNSLLVA